jgi:hypothetical protein
MKYEKGRFNIKAGCLIIVILGILSYAGLAVFQCAQDNKGDPPDLKAAPYLVTTSSRIYLAQTGFISNSTDNTTNILEHIIGTYPLTPGESLTMTNWYDQNSEGKWKYHKGGSPKLVQLAEGNVTIIKREEAKSK